MSKILCPCGEVLSNGEVPSDIVIRAYPDRQYDDMLDYIGRDKPDEWPPEPQIEIWRCPVCRRMLVFETDFLRPVVYKIEKDYTKNEWPSEPIQISVPASDSSSGGITKEELQEALNDVNKRRPTPNSANYWSPPYKTEKFL